MSFTAQVKDELSRAEGGCDLCGYAQLSAIMRVCGTLSFRGSGRYALRVSTETGSVARTMLKLLHQLFELETRLTVRHSVLHKTRNYLIEMPEQDALEPTLVRLGILVPGHGLASGVPTRLLASECCRRSFLRGAFMAGGFIADPRGDFHLEIAVTGEEFASQIVGLMEGFGIHARLNHRRGSYAIYLKSYAGILELLRVMGGDKSVQALEHVSQVKWSKNNANRQANADFANVTRATNAAGAQLALVGRALQDPALADMPPALAEFCELRTQNPELSLAELGALATPAVSKSAMYHRLLRLQALVGE